MHKDKQAFHRLSMRTKIHDGFTLLELLLVVLIIGITLSFVIPAFHANSDMQAYEREIKRLAQAIALAADDATLNARHIGVEIKPDHYLFLVRSDDEWTPLHDRVFKRVQLPNSMRLEMVNSPRTQAQDQPGLSESEETAHSPNIILSRSGEMTPFNVRLVGKDKSAYFELSGFFSGHLKITELDSKRQ